MKLAKTIVMAIALSSTVSSAATTIYTMTTGTTATSSGIANAAGLQFQNSSVPAFTSAGPGSVAFGYFNISDAALTAATSASTLTSAFVNWNTSVQSTSTFNAPGPTQQRGVFSITAAARDITTAGFDAKNMYVFAGNGTTFANSDQFLILKTSFTFSAADSGPTPFSKTITTGNSSVLFGTQVLDVRTTATDSSATAGWNTAAVPEASTALLGAIGALGLLRRRRN
jgi:hypothetical protein